MKSSLLPAILAAVIIFLVIIAVAAIYLRQSDYESGFWQADEAFCREAGLGAFYLLIGERECSRHGYLLVQSGTAATVVNEPVELDFDYDFCMSNWLPKTLRTELNGSISFKGASFTSRASIPRSMRFILYPMLGKLVLYQNDVVFAVLYKSGAASEALLSKIMPVESNFQDSESLFTPDAPAQPPLTQSNDAESLT